MQTRKNTAFPHPGQRIIRSTAAVLLCFGVYLLRGRTGIPFYSAIAALQCMQPYTQSMRTVARKRVVGTLVGAFWGLAALLLETQVIGSDTSVFHYLIVGLFTGIVLYFTVLIRVTEASYFSAVVFLCIAVNHIGDANPYLFVLHRVLDTVIGVAVAELVNRLQLPRRRNTQTLFLSGINDTIIGAGKKLSPYAKVELNRLIQDGAQFTISTIQAPATVRELLSGVDIRLPIITMNGAALYDLQKMEYLKIVHMSAESARRMTEVLDTRGLNYFTNSVEEHLLVVHCGRLGDGALRQLFESKRSSPYRNFMRHKKPDDENLVYFMVLDAADKVDALYAEILRQPWHDAYRLVYDEAKAYPGEKCLKIYAPQARRDLMARELADRLGLPEVVTFGSIPGYCDVLIEDADKDVMVKELKHRFEPVDWRCWRSILRLK